MLAQQGASAGLCSYLIGWAAATGLVESNWALDWFSQDDYQSPPLSGIHRVSHLLGMKQLRSGEVVVQVKWPKWQVESGLTPSLLSSGLCAFNPAWSHTCPLESDQ